MNPELISFKDLQNWLDLATKDAVEKWLIKHKIPFKAAPGGIVTTATALNKSIFNESTLPRVVKAKSQ